MQLEKITDDKIRIILNIQDLKEKNIDLHSFMSNSIESQDFFYELLSIAKKEIGFETKDYKLLIEAITIPNRRIYINSNSNCFRNKSKKKNKN